MTAAIAVVTEAATTTCRACDESKPDGDFYATRHGKPYLDCKRCHNRRVVKARQAKRAEVSP